MLGDVQNTISFGALYRLDPDFKVTKLDEGIIVSNGPCWSPDDKTFYFADSWSGEIWAYDYDIKSGKVSNRRTFTKLDTSVVDAWLARDAARSAAAATPAAH